MCKPIGDRPIQIKPKTLAALGGQKPKGCTGDCKACPFSDVDALKAQAAQLKALRAEIASAGQQ